MSDTPTPPASGPAPADPTPPTESPRRPWTILGRLSKAVREQNWFAVVLEVCIVIVGVVIGFQVTSWGQDRADRIQEQHYLHQLVEDLKRTEETYESLLGTWSLRDSSITWLMRSFRTASPPPADSVLMWSEQAITINRPFIVTGTANALVATGDLNLIRDDSLRSGITFYIDRVEYERSRLEHIDEEMRPFVISLTERVDFVEGLFGVSPAGRERARTWPMSPMPGGEHRTIMPLDVEALFRDQTAYTAVSNIWRLRIKLKISRRSAIRRTVALREQVEAELNR